MYKNIKLISIVLFTLFSFFILLKGLDKSNIYAPEIKESNIDFNFKAKYLFSEKEVFFDELLNNEGMSLINIWASWCLPCRDEHKYLLSLKSINKLSIIGINYKDNEKNAKQFISELGNPYTNIITDPTGVNSIELGAFGVPETYLIDNKSKLIIKKFIGPLDNESFVQLTKIIK
jgi:cytochrome c biogenesis protein CcmG/thiol:disulfide interchange protein DsbE